MSLVIENHEAVGLMYKTVNYSAICLMMPHWAIPMIPFKLQ